MKYLGEKSLSSVLYGLMSVSWYLIILGTIFIEFILSVAMFSKPNEDPAVKPFEMFKEELFKSIKEDPDAWSFFTTQPAGIKVLALIFVFAVVILLLSIIKKAKQIFKNFKGNVVFTEENVKIISKTSKLLIAFSIITFNFSTFFASIILLILSEVFKNGAALQEEHDLTV